ncbi:hypothetical protein JIX56_37725 [Streptomyces sp. CA-210063]|uniref:hypothetical protein n=1 Tax=Streptomyces sp. CA-210063 TaxID=2801029 RepID=UPI00214B0DB0|nr:hypothetical protein [Streptomyces sp. CA-210063]UUU35143.1 hypothetical protein JIX56_37725 [Streptomyces sp. CA-210063]
MERGDEPSAEKPEAAEKSEARDDRLPGIGAESSARPPEVCAAPVRRPAWRAEGGASGKRAEAGGGASSGSREAERESEKRVVAAGGASGKRAEAAGGGGAAGVPPFWPTLRRKSEKRGCSTRWGAAPPSTTEPREGLCPTD